MIKTLIQKGIHEKVDQPNLVAKMATLSSVLIFLGACTAVGPNYQRSAQVTSLPNTFLIDEVVTSGKVLKQQWWRDFNDPLLDQLLEKAFKENIDLQEAQAKIRELDANLREVGGSLLPEVGFSSSGTRSRASQRTATVQPGVSPLRTNLRLGLSTSYELDFWGKAYRTLEAANAQAVAGRYAKETLQISLSSLIVQNYWSIRAVDLRKRKRLRKHIAKQFV
jgi:outer membrane protein, multidrug efflux system